MVRDDKILHIGGDVTVEGMINGVVSVCLNESVPVSLPTSVFWKLTRPRNQNDDISFVYVTSYYFMQVAFIILGIHIVSFILKPLRLPRFSVELLAGILIGQGLHTWVLDYAVPIYSRKVLEALGYLSLIAYVFMVGLEIDLFTVRYVGRKAVYTGLTGMILPFFIGFIQFFVLAADPRYPNFFSSGFWENLVAVKLTGAIFWGVSLTVTSFPDLAKILSDIKLLHTDIGRLALSSSIVSELMTWILLVVALTLNNGTLNPLYLLPTFSFLVASWFLVRPAVTWVLMHADETDNKLLLNFTIFGGILTSSIITEACGANSVIGAFVFGLIIPNDGNVSVKLMESFEDYVKGILMPAVFLINGIRTSWRIFSLPDSESMTPLYIVLLLVIVACSAKIASTFVFSKLAGMTTREAFTIGVLMNTKGVLALIIVNSGRNNQAFNNLMFVVLMLSMFIMSVTVIPLAKAANKSNKKPNQFKHRTVESNKLESELRILTCIHSTRNLPGMLNLLHFSNASKQYPISVFALHLVQLTDRRATAMLIVHETKNDDNNDDDNENKNNSNHMREGSGRRNLSRREEESKHIITKFERLEKTRGASVSAQTLTVVSPYATMHEDISSLGEDKRVTLILVPFHKQADVNGRLQEENLNWKIVNKNLMATATCSVGMLVDRGFGSKDKTISFAVIFIGGPDDREALAYGWRIAKSPNVNLTVLRLLPTNNDDANLDDDDDDDIEKVSGRATTTTRSKRGVDEKEVDNEYVNEFRFRTMHDESIRYVEKRVKTGEEVITMIARVVPSVVDLYLLGQSKNVTSSIMLGLSAEWMECDELGVLGDALLTSQFAERSSLLVIKQHYVPGMRTRIHHNGNHKNMH